jgi:hypothetical protein
MAQTHRLPYSSAGGGKTLHLRGRGWIRSCHRVSGVSFLEIYMKTGACFMKTTFSAGFLLVTSFLF